MTFCSREDNFRIDFCLLWEAVKNQNYPKHKLVLAAVQNTRYRKAEYDFQNKNVIKIELSLKAVKPLTEETEINLKIEAKVTPR